MGRPDYIFGKFRETARCATRGRGLLCFRTTACYIYGLVCRTDALSCENRSTTTTSSTISELPVTPPADSQLTLAPTTDDDNWPPPPSPITEACTAATPLSAGEVSETPGSSSPVVRFTFTVKLDSQLLKRRRRQLDEASETLAQLALDDDDDQTPSASPPETRPASSKPRPEMAVVIPDVVVCADAVDSKKQGVDDDRHCVKVVQSPTDTVAQRGLRYITLRHAQYTPPTPTRLNSTVASHWRRRCIEH